ncbi:MAG: ABC transporter permease [Candidatus Methanomethylophilaceae archaeon]|nr:ABC transporter permease [Candidatus Methanomethylophilaceae archaeon]
MTFKYDSNNKYHRLGKNILVVIASLIIFAELWWFIAELIDSRVLPTPPETFEALKNFLSDGYLGISAWDYISSSLVLFLKGFLLAFVVAVPLGLILGFSKTLNTFVTPVVEVLRPIAPMAWAPIFIYGISYGVGPVLVVFIGIFFPLLTNIIFGVKKIDPSLVDAARTLGANKVQVFTKVMAPSSIPYVMNGVKVGLGVGWMCIVAAEMYSPVAIGVGYCISNMCMSGMWDSTFAMLIVIAVLGILTTSLSEYLQKYISKRMGVE